MRIENFFYTIKNSILEFKIIDVVDILIVAFILYYVIKLTRKTRAVQVLKGVGVFVLFAAVCELIGLTTISWLLSQFLSVAAIMLVILFQPELRKAFEKVGTGKLIDINIVEESLVEQRAVGELHKAILNLSMHKVGALIVFEKKTGLRDVMESGTEIDAKVTSQLVENVFFKNSPLHDGAMIIRNARIAAAGCFLPMSDNKNISSELGTRHRAALGISEMSDCTVIIVSEETGVISVANEGMLTRYVDSKSLTRVLELQLLKESSKVIKKIRKKKVRK